MSENWAERQRRTNRLTRAIARHVFRKNRITSEQLYGLCKLTWITGSYDTADAKYISSTKIPALGSALSRNYDGWSLSDVADDVSRILGTGKSRELVVTHTGFTHFYKPYCNSCRGWLDENRRQVESLFRRAFALASDRQGLEIIQAIQRLPRIPKANVSSHRMKPEYLLTPVIFSLDKRIRFPIINGNEGVRALLSAIGATSLPLDEQYKRMIQLYREGEIRDAADLDQIGSDLPDFIQVGDRRPSKKLLEQKETSGNALPIKDENDITSLQKAKTVKHRQLHNVLTNAIRKALASFTLLEGRDSSALFDVLVKNYNNEGEDLLIEVKSSTQSAHVRMAIGQLFDYWFTTYGDCLPHIAILTPNRPCEATVEMLRWLKIGVLWIENGTLKTCSERLRSLCND